MASLSTPRTQRSRQREPPGSIARPQSGAKSERRELARALKAIAAGDTLFVTRLDRLARSTRDLLNILDAVAPCGVVMSAQTSASERNPAPALALSRRRRAAGAYPAGAFSMSRPVLSCLPMSSALSSIPAKPQNRASFESFGAEAQEPPSRWRRSRQYQEWSSTAGRSHQLGPLAQLPFKQPYLLGKGGNVVKRLSPASFVRLGLNLHIRQVNRSKATCPKHLANRIDRGQN